MEERSAPTPELLEPQPPDGIEPCTVEVCESAELNEFALAMSKFQSEIVDPVCNHKVIVRTAKGPYEYEYADLASCWKAVRPLMAKYEIAILQMPVRRETATEPLRIVQKILHSSGQWIKYELSAMPAQNTPQGIGSCLSYLRRYLLHLLGFAPVGEDDDGSAGEGRFGSDTIENLQARNGNGKPKSRSKNGGAANNIYEGMSTVEKNHVERVKILSKVLKDVLNDPDAEWTSEWLMERKPSDDEWADVKTECDRITNEYLDELTELADRK